MRIHSARRRPAGVVPLALALSVSLSFGLPACLGAPPAAAEKAPCAPCFAGAPAGIRHPALGPVYPNVEPDFVEAAEAAAASAVESGEWRRRFSAQQRALAQWADAPASAGPLPRAKAAVEAPLRPLAAALFEREEAQDAQDAQGAADASRPPRPRLSALFAGWRRTLVFIDGEDPAQRAYAAMRLLEAARAAGITLDGAADAPGEDAEGQDGGKEDALLAAQADALRRGAAPLPLVVLEAGRLSETAALLPPALRRRVRFDQGGSLRRAFGISEGPAEAALSPKRITVRTVPIDELGRPIPGPVRTLPEREQPMPAALRREAEEAVRRLLAGRERFEAAPAALASEAAAELSARRSPESRP